MPADNKTAARTAAADTPDLADALDPADTPGTSGTADATGTPEATDTPDLAARVVSATAKHATLRYTTLRIAIFIISLGVLWGGVAATGHIVTGNGVLYLMMGSLLVSGVASFFLLSRQRDAMSAQVTRRTEKLTATVRANAALEDED
ncbi:hypothetical protein GCM10009839_05860 [Catenulispora yoronensis]|uniref:DUF202 domain-containing protein n=1 Tax=Catenulispora yoronensis TaxID=450799 RepID=A0ABN2TLT2_9ACTN